MTAGWCARTVRTAVFAAVCVLLAALGHVLMSGSHVPLWTLAAGTVVTGAAGWCLAGRERGLPLIVSVVVVVQTALHTSFSLAQSAGSSASAAMRSGMDSPYTGQAGRTGHLEHSGHSGHSGMSHVDHAEHLVGGGSSSTGMLAAHLLAALLCGLWLAHGERAAFRILRAVAGWLAAPLRLPLTPPAPPHRPRIRVRSRRADRAPRLLLLVHAIVLRGPPVGTAVV
ncbi:hypothetical protein [Streptomyces sp. NPDC002845]